jgi:hypothetical protein
MKSMVLGLRVASVVFGLVSLVQLARLLIRFQVIIAGYEIPLWPNALAFVILGGLSLWMWKLAKTATK